MSEARDEALEREPSNVDLLRQGTEALNRGDSGFIFEHAAEDVEVHTSAGLINAGTYHGREGLERWLGGWLEAWSDFEIDIRRVEELHGRFLVVEVRQRATGAGSGIPVEMELVQLVDVRDGEIARIHLYTTRDEALEVIERLVA